jgi:L-lactate dehydrogenase complex protein LldF
LITGTKSGREDEGPDDLHIVLLDNGRSRMLSHPVTRQSLACIRCGACLNACPVYQQIGGHAYGSVYAGPIGAVITPQLLGIERTSQLPYASSLCGACRDVCPVKIDIPALLLHLRGQIVARGAGGKRPLERLAFRAYAAIMGRPRLYERAARLGRLLQRLGRVGERVGAQRGIVGRLAPPLGAWTAWRDLKPLAPRSFREQWRGSLSAARSGEHRESPRSDS